MYLEKKTYVKNWDYKGADNHKIKITKNGKKTGIDEKKVSHVIEEAGYWRKANHIHNWFVQNVQEGDDNCGLYYVSQENMEELLGLVNEVLENSKLVKGKVIRSWSFDKNGEKLPNYQEGKNIKDPSKAKELLPCQEGFFFGNDEYDEWYYNGLVETKKILEEAMEDEDADYYYQSSW